MYSKGYKSFLSEVRNYLQERNRSFDWMVELFISYDQGTLDRVESALLSNGYETNSSMQDGYIIVYFDGNDDALATILEDVFGDPDEEIYAHDYWALIIQNDKRRAK